MWCPKCRYGNSTLMMQDKVRCPQCGSESETWLSKPPFPGKPMGKGSFNATGKTARRRRPASQVQGA